MKRKWLFILGIILFLVFVGLGCFMVLKDKISYQSLEKSGNNNYECNIIFNSEEEDGIDYRGIYTHSNNNLSLMDDAEELVENISINVYQEFLPWIRDLNYQDNSTLSARINMKNMVEKSPKLKKIIRTAKQMDCKYEIYEKRITSIICTNDLEEFAIDFYFAS